jgi:hypothetical protein
MDSDIDILSWRELRDRLLAAKARIERLENFIRSQALCPCCEEYEQCVDGCTFRDDCFAEWERMDEARRVLRGDNGP